MICSSNYSTLSFHYNKQTYAICSHPVVILSTQTWISRKLVWRNLTCDWTPFPFLSQNACNTIVASFGMTNCRKQWWIFRVYYFFLRRSFQLNARGVLDGMSASRSSVISYMVRANVLPSLKRIRVRTSLLVFRNYFNLECFPMLYLLNLIWVPGHQSGSFCWHLYCNCFSCISTYTVTITKHLKNEES